VTVTIGYANSQKVSVGTLLRPFYVIVCPRHILVSRVSTYIYTCTYHNFPFTTLNSVLFASLTRQ